MWAINRLGLVCSLWTALLTPAWADGVLTGAAMEAAGLINMPAASVAGWTATTAGGTPDVGLSRLGAASMALGNGTASNITGSLSLKTLTHSSAEIDTSFSYNAPATGGTITPAVGEQRTIINPAGTIATLTINTPASPVNGQIWGFGCTQIVTTLTVTAVGGATILGAPATCAVGHRGWLYRAANTTWYPVP